MTSTVKDLGADQGQGSLGELISVAVEVESLSLRSGVAIAGKVARARVSIAELSHALHCHNALARIKALSLISYFENSESLPLFAMVLQDDPSPVVRHEAAYFLGMSGAEDAAEHLGLALSRDVSNLVRHEAAEALGEHGSGRAAYWLRRALNDPVDEVAETAAVALERLQAPRLSR